MLGKGRQRTPKDMRASKAVAVGLALGVPVAVTVFEVIGGPATVTGTSMQPSFNPTGSRVCDVVWVNRLPVAARNLRCKPGQVVVIRRIVDDSMVKVWLVTAQVIDGEGVGMYALWNTLKLRSPSDSREAMIKRVVANGRQNICSRSYRRRQLIVPPGHLWVEGDNGRTSRDSNQFGPVSEGLVTGVVSHIIWPPLRWQKVKHQLTAEQEKRRTNLPNFSSSVDGFQSACTENSSSAEPD